jgi:Uma2 family endonuclease
LTTGAKMTAEELLRMPDDGFRCELVRGELVKMPFACAQHGYVTMQVGGRLAKYVKTNKLGTVYAAGTGFQNAFNPDTVRAPDVSFVNKKRKDEAGNVEGYLPGPPDLAVEVISPSDTYTEVEDKVHDWLDASTLMVIVVNLRRQTVTVYRSRTDIVILTKDEELDGQDVVPGWTLRIADVFA